MVRILNLEPEDYSRDAREMLESFAAVDYRPMSRSELLDAIDEYHGVIVRLGHDIDEAVLSEATNLEAVATATTGLNHIDTTAADALGIEVISLRGEREFLDSIYATAEHTWALLLGVIRHLPTASNHVVGGGWDRDQFKGHELHDATLGVVGYGRLGSKVAKYGDAFGMHVLAHDPNVQQGEYASFVDLERLLTDADYVTIHVPYDETTVGLIGAEEFETMKETSYMINTSRGGIANESDLLTALEAGEIAGAALDVLAGEYDDGRDRVTSDPLVEYARDHDNLIITPHIAGATWESMGKTEVFIARKLAEFFEE